MNNTGSVIGKFRQKDHVMHSFVSSRKLAVLLTAGLCANLTAPAVAQARQALTKTPQGGNSAIKQPASKGLTIGTMQFKYGELELSPGRDVVMRGPDVQMEATDTKRGLHIVVTADNAVGHRLADNKNTAQVSGNVHYTLTQQIPATAQSPAQTRTVEGTAQRATYSEVGQNLRLLGGVRATINDPTRFDGPASVRCTTLNLEGGVHYEITSDANSADMQFTPHVLPAPASTTKLNAAANAKPTTQASGIGRVHITGFRTGHLRENEDARFEGPLVTVETLNAQTKSQNTFKAPEVTASLQKDQRRVDAKGGIQFDNHTVDAKGHAQRIEGTANSAFWSEDDGRMEANGNISATLTNAFTLKEPATLTAGHLTAEITEEPRYTITGPPDKTRFAFYPNPGKGKGKNGTGHRAQGTGESVVAPQPSNKNAAPPAANLPVNKPLNVSQEQGIAQGADNQDPAGNEAPGDTQPTTHNPPFAFGRIVVTGFQTATYAPGDSMTVEGPKVRFTSTNADAQNFADLTTPHLTAEFDGDNAIASMQATNGVTYRFEQPVKEHKEARWIAGDGASATFTSTEQAHTVEVKGVKIIDYYTPEYLEEMAHTEFTNKDGDIHYDLTTNGLLLASPSRSGDTHMKPYQPQQPARPANVKKKRK